MAHGALFKMRLLQMTQMSCETRRENANVSKPSFVTLDRDVQERIVRMERDVSKRFVYAKWSIQHTATHCNTLQHTATHCNILQHAATHCISLSNFRSLSLFFFLSFSFSLSQIFLSICLACSSSMIPTSIYSCDKSPFPHHKLLGCSFSTP